MILEELLLLSHNDIPFIDAQINIHNPLLKEIAVIGEEQFWNGLYFLNFNKERYLVEDNSGIEELSNFEVFMMVLNNKKQFKYYHGVLCILNLLFPACQIKITDGEIVLIEEKDIHRINGENFETFKEILVQMFALNDEDSKGMTVSPANGLAQRIAEKLQKGRQKVAKAKGEISGDKTISILARYISILAAGQQKDINSLLNYTVYQLKDEIQRFKLKYGCDMYFRAQIAGAKGMDKPEKDWMDAIH